MISPGAILAAFLVVLPAPPTAPTRDVLRPSHAETFARHEVTRLRAHFDSVHTELVARSTVSLTAQQRAARQHLILWLRDYRNAGRFPRNDRFPKQTVPFFRDSRGVLCAMAYLVERSGRSDLVNRIARTANTATIAELSGDAALRAWLDSVGFSATEAGRVQPTYGSPDQLSTSDVVDSRNGNLHPAMSMTLNMASLATAAVNIRSPAPASAWIGVAVGLTGFIAGAKQISENRDAPAYAISNMVTGTAAVALAAMRLIRPSAPARGKVASAADDRAQQRMAPTITFANGHPQLGVMLQRRFR